MLHSPSICKKKSVALSLLSSDISPLYNVGDTVRVSCPAEHCPTGNVRNDASAITFWTTHYHDIRCVSRDPLVLLRRMAPQQ